MVTKEMVRIMTYVKKKKWKVSSLWLYAMG